MHACVHGWMDDHRMDAFMGARLCCHAGGHVNIAMPISSGSLRAIYREAGALTWKPLAISSDSDKLYSDSDKLYSDSDKLSLELALGHLAYIYISPIYYIYIYIYYYLLLGFRIWSCLHTSYRTRTRPYVSLSLSVDDE
jgi:hypothetical protein